jgi:hypothetical protein
MPQLTKAVTFYEPRRLGGTASQNPLTEAVNIKEPASQNRGPIGGPSQPDRRLCINKNPKVLVSPRSLPSLSSFLAQSRRAPSPSRSRDAPALPPVALSHSLPPVALSHSLSPVTVRRWPASAGPSFLAQVDNSRASFLTQVAGEHGRARRQQAQVASEWRGSLLPRTGGRRAQVTGERRGSLLPRAGGRLAGPLLR